MTRLLQISDTHFGTEQPHVMQALLGLAHAEKPDVLVLSGDITQRASAGQFRRARDFCDQLAIPRMLSLPGNHDIPLFNIFSRLFRPYAAYLDAFGPELEPQLQTATLCLLGVKTTQVRSIAANSPASPFGPSARWRCLGCWRAACSGVWEKRTTSTVLLFASLRCRRVVAIA